MHDITIIGLGLMGEALALQQAGHELADLSIVLVSMCAIWEPMYFFSPRRKARQEKAYASWRLCEKKSFELWSALEPR